MNSSYFKRLGRAYLRSAGAAAKTLFSQIIIVPLVLVAYWILSILFGLIANLHLGLAGGFVSGMLQLCFISYLYKWIVSARAHQLPSFSSLSPIKKEDPWAHIRAKQRGFWFQDLFAFDAELFSSIINAAFPIFIAEFVVSGLSQSTLSIPIFVKLAIVILFNPLPEVIIVNRTSGVSAISEALSFLKANVLEWYFPILILFSPLLLLLGDFSMWFESIVLLLTRSEVLIPGELLAMPAIQLVGLLVPQLSLVIIVLGTAFGVWFSLFRLEFFEHLQSLPKRDLP